MTNPYLLDAKYKQWIDPRFMGGKVYLALIVGDGYARAARRIFKRASLAEAYAIRLRDRWLSMYDAKVKEPTA